MKSQIAIWLWLLFAGSQATSIPYNEDLHNEVTDVKKTLTLISERLDRWDTLLGRLEPRMIGAAVSLANLDTNIKNLQERAHTWDTFQLHVSAWNEQIKSLDNKMGIINHGQEKIEEFNTKLSSFVELNHSVHGVDQRLSELNDKLESLSNGVLHKEPQNPLFHAFTGRDVLRALLNLEEKVDRIRLNMDYKLSRSVFRPSKDVEDKCTTAKALEDLLRDVASKVDVIFDRSNDEDVVDVNANDAEDVEIRHLGKTCKRLVAPYKKLLTAMDYLQAAVKGISVNDESANLQKLPLRNSVMEEIRRNLEDIDDEIGKLRRKNDRNINENERILRRIDKKLESAIRDDDDDDESLKKSLKNFIVDQRRQLERNLKDILKEDDDDDDDDDDDSSSSSDDKTEEKSRRKKKHHDSDDDDDDDTDEDKSRKRSRNDSDDDDDDTDEDRSRKRSRNDSDDDTEEDRSRKRSRNDSDDTEEDRSKKRSRNNSDDDDDDTDEDQSKKHSRNDSDDDDDDDSRDKDRPSRRRKNSRKNNDKDDDDDDDSAPPKTRRNSKVKVRSQIEKSRDVEEVTKHDDTDKLSADMGDKGASLMSKLGWTTDADSTPAKPPVK